MSTVRTRELGEELRVLRNAAGLSFVETHESLEMSAGWLSKLETGARRTSDMELGALLGLYRASREDRERIARLVSELDADSLLRLHGGSPDTLAALRVNERLMTELTVYDPLMVPSMVQTEGYARAVVDERAVVEARMARQRLLLDDPGRKTTVFVTQASLRRPVGGPGVMHEQVLRLVLMCGWHWKHVTVRAIPDGTAVDRALLRPVTLMVLPPPHGPVVYEETDVAGVFHDDVSVVEASRRAIARLDALALSEDKSQAMLTKWASAHERQVK